MNEPAPTSANMKALRDLETTYDLLQATMPSIKSPNAQSSKKIALLSPSYSSTGQKLKTPSPYAASSEDEIYFGAPTDKELNGKNARYVQRWTKTKGGRRKTLNMDTEKWRQRRSLYNPENSIEEEKDEDEENYSPEMLKNGAAIHKAQSSTEYYENYQTEEQLGSLITKLAVSPMKEITVHNILKQSSEHKQNNIELAPNASPIPSPRKVKPVTMSDETCAEQEDKTELVFGLGLVGENIPSFKHPIAGEKLVDDQICCFNERKYRSRSPLQREESNSVDGEQKIISEHEKKEYTNFPTKDTCKLDGEITGSPKPKLRTKFSNYEEVQDTAITSCHITVSDDTCTTKTSENKNIDTIEMIKSPSLKWRRRSIKQSNYESDDDQEKDLDLTSTTESNSLTPELEALQKETDNCSIRNKSPTVKTKTNKSFEKNEILFEFNNDDGPGSDEESSLIDVNNDQMFDDTVFTDYDDLSISRMTQKMSKHWRKKFKSEDNIKAQTTSDDLSLQELVQRQGEKSHNQNFNSIVDYSKSREDLNVTDNRKRRTKPINTEVTRGYRINSPDIVAPTVIDETLTSVTSTTRDDYIENDPLTKVEQLKTYNYQDDSKKDAVTEEHMSLDVTTPCPDNYTPNSPADTSNLSTCSDWFNTTREEMILYEKFGEDYDIIVEKMSKNEKVKLKEEVSKATPKDAKELLEQEEIDSAATITKGSAISTTSILESRNIHSDKESTSQTSETSDSFAIKMNLSPTKELKIMDRPSHFSNNSKSPIKDSVVDTILESIAPSACNYFETRDEHENGLKAPEKYISTSLESLGEEIKSTAEKNKYMQDLEKSSSKSNSSMQGNKSDAEVLNASYNNSLLERVNKAQEENRKNIQDEDVHHVISTNKSTPNINPNSERKIFGTPKEFKFKTPNSGRLTPRTGGHISGNHFGTKIATNSNGLGSFPSYRRETKASTLKKSPTKNNIKSSPSTGNLFPSPLDFVSKRGLPSSVVDMDKIVSPVAQYINANPVPPTMKHIRPKASKFLHCEIQEFLNDPIEASPGDAHKITSKTPSKKYFAPLPAAKYCSSKLAVQIPVAPDESPKELPKAFGVVNTVQAKVVKHVGRTKIPRNLAHEEILKVTENMATWSPNSIAIGTPSMQTRDSILLSRESCIGGNTIDQSTMEMSLQETKEIKKPTSSTLDRKLK